MQVTCLYASPRPNGNSAQIANKFCDEAESLGAKVKRFALGKLNFKGCQGCDVCKTRLDHCVLNDDLTQVLKSVKETDILVLATPVYYGDVASQLKAFIDRTYSFIEADYLTNPNASRLEKGKKLLFIQSQEAGENSYKEIFSKYLFFFKFYGFKDSNVIQAFGLGQKSNGNERQIFLNQAAKTAKIMCSNP